MCIVPVVGPFANWAMPKGGVEILHDGITPFILAMMWYSCYPSWYLAFSLYISGEWTFLDFAFSFVVNN